MKTTEILKKIAGATPDVTPFDVGGRLRELEAWRDRVADPAIHERIPAAIDDAVRQVAAYADQKKNEVLADLAAARQDFEARVAQTRADLAADVADARASVQQAAAQATQALEHARAGHRALFERARDAYAGLYRLAHGIATQFGRFASDAYGLGANFYNPLVAPGYLVSMVNDLRWALTSPPDRPTEAPWDTPPLVDHLRSVADALGSLVESLADLTGGDRRLPPVPSIPAIAGQSLPPGEWAIAFPYGAVPAEVASTPNPVPGVGQYYVLWTTGEYTLAAGPAPPDIGEWRTASEWGYGELPPGTRLPDPGLGKVWHLKRKVGAPDCYWNGPPTTPAIAEDYPYGWVPRAVAIAGDPHGAQIPAAGWNWVRYTDGTYNILFGRGSNVPTTAGRNWAQQWGYGVIPPGTRLPPPPVGKGWVLWDTGDYSAETYTPPPPPAPARTYDFPYGSIPATKAAAPWQAVMPPVGLHWTLWSDGSYSINAGGSPADAYALPVANEWGYGAYPASLGDPLQVGVVWRELRTPSGVPNCYIRWYTGTWPFYNDKKYL